MVSELQNDVATVTPAVLPQPVAARLGPPLEVVVVGAGSRFSAYHRKYIVSHPDRIRIVGIADPDTVRRDELAQRHQVPAERCFASWEDVAARPGLAPAVINTTMDRVHYPSAMALLRAGYDMLLEKPIADSQEQVQEIIDTSRRLRRRVMVCHGMRYSPFYYKIKELIAQGAIGRVMSIAAAEYVSYDHMAGAFVRGKWRNTRDALPMILAKCCHDTDMIVWLMEGIRPRRVASFGSLMHFKADQAPAGSSDRCMSDCRVEPTCIYSARSLYLSRVDPAARRQAEMGQEIDDATVATNLEALRTDSPYGRCVWRCDNDVVDHQTMIIEFEDGAVATLNMIGNAARATRDIHIVGTKGEIKGDMKEGLLHLRKPWPHDFDRRYSEETFDIPHGPDNHAGNDERVIADFVAMMLDEATSKARTRVEDSLMGHRLGFAAEIAREQGRVVTL